MLFNIYKQVKPCKARGREGERAREFIQQELPVGVENINSNNL